MHKSEKFIKIVYSPDSQLRTPISLFRSMWSDLSASRELSWRLFIRDLSAQYRQSLLGVIWTFIPPIVTSLVFIILQANNVVNFGETEIPYPVYVIVGTILWQLFTESLNAPLKSVTSSKQLLARVNFPREALIVSSFLMVMFSMMIKLIVIVMIFLVFDLPITKGLVLAPIGAMPLLLLGICLGLLLTPFGMLYTDVASGLPVLTQLLFFLTPVVYPPLLTFPISLFILFNPISPLLIGARDLITTGSIYNVIPFVLVSVFTVIFIFIGWVIYRVALPIIIERMSA